MRALILLLSVRRPDPGGPDRLPLVPGGRRRRFRRPRGGSSTPRASSRTPPVGETATYRDEQGETWTFKVESRRVPGWLGAPAPDPDLVQPAGTAAGNPLPGGTHGLRPPPDAARPLPADGARRSGRVRPGLGLGSHPAGIASLAGQVARALARRPDRPGPAGGRAMPTTSSPGSTRPCPCSASSAGSAAVAPGISIEWSPR